MELMLPMYIEECDMNWEDIGAICNKAEMLAWGSDKLWPHWPGDSIHSSARRRSIHCPYPFPYPSGRPDRSWRSPPSPPSSSWTWRTASGSWSGSRPSSWSGAAQPEIRDSLVRGQIQRWDWQVASFYQSSMYQDQTTGLNWYQGLDCKIYNKQPFIKKKIDLVNCKEQLLRAFTFKTLIIGLGVNQFQIDTPQSIFDW